MNSVPAGWLPGGCDEEPSIAQMVVFWTYFHSHWAAIRLAFLPFPWPTDAWYSSLASPKMQARIYQGVSHVDHLLEDNPR